MFISWADGIMFSFTLAMIHGSAVLATQEDAAVRTRPEPG
jgi:hypothetical protein